MVTAHVITRFGGDPSRVLQCLPNDSVAQILERCIVARQGTTKNCGDVESKTSVDGTTLPFVCSRDRISAWVGGRRIRTPPATTLIRDLCLLSQSNMGDSAGKHGATSVIGLTFQVALVGGGGGASKSGVVVVHGADADADADALEAHKAMQRELEDARKARADLERDKRLLELTNKRLEAALREEELAKAAALEAAMEHEEEMAAERAKANAAAAARNDLDLIRSQLEADLLLSKERAMQHEDLMLDAQREAERVRSGASSELAKATSAVGELASRAASLQSLADTMNAERESTLMHREAAARELDDAVRRACRLAEADKVTSAKAAKLEHDQETMRLLQESKHDYESRVEEYIKNLDKEKEVIWKVIKARPDSAVLMAAIEAAKQEAASRMHAVPEGDERIRTLEERIAFQEEEARLSLQSEEERAAAEAAENAAQEAAREANESAEDAVLDSLAESEHLMADSGPSLLQFVIKFKPGNKESKDGKEVQLETVASHSDEGCVPNMGFWRRERLLCRAGALARAPPRVLPAESVRAVLQGELCGETTFTVPKTMLRLFSSSGDGDSELERNAIRRRSHPILRELAALLGLTFEVIDARWGVQIATIADHLTEEHCKAALQQAQRVSLGPAFVALVGNKYGERPLPRCIQSREFEKVMHYIKRKQIEDMSLLLDKWFILDTNANPPRYVLQPIDQSIPEFVHPDAEPFARGRKEWLVKLEQLQGMLHIASESCLPPEEAEKYSQSLLDKEVRLGGLNNANRNEQAIVFQRHMLNVSDNNTDDVGVETYFDLEGAEDERYFNKSAMQLLETLRTDCAVPGRFKNTRLIPFPIQWAPGGVQPEHFPEHEEYINSLVASYTNTIAQGVIAAYRRHHDHVDPVVREAMLHVVYAQKLSETFVGRAADLKRLGVYSINSDFQNPFIVWGGVGCGKSALMAKGAAMASTALKGSITIIRFIKYTADSSGTLPLLRSLCAQVAQVLGQTFKHDYASDIADLSRTLQALLGRARSDRPILIWIDGLDALVDNDSTGVASTSWIPVILPRYVKMVISTRTDTGDCLQSLKSKIHDQERYMEVGVMTREEAEEVVTTTLANDASRQLNRTQRQAIVDGFHFFQQPLYLSLALELSKSWCSYTKPPTLGNSTSDLIISILRLAEAQHGSTLVCHALSYLECSRHGLTFGELEDILSLDEEVLDAASVRHKPSTRRFPPLLWLQLSSQLSALVTDRDSNTASLLQWTQRSAGEAVRKRYLSVPSIKQGRHEVLAQYFGGVWAGKAKPFVSAITDLDGGDAGWVNVDLDEADRLVAAQPLIVSGAVGATDATVNSRRVAEHVYHLERAGCMGDDIVRLKFSLEYAEYMCSTQQAGTLINEYIEALSTERDNSVPDDVEPHAKELLRFFVQQQHVIGRNPRVLMQQLLAQPADSAVRKVAEQALAGLEQRGRDCGPYLQRLTPQRQRNACLMRISAGVGESSKEKIVGAAFSPDDASVCIITTAQRLAWYNMANGQFIKDIPKFASPLTAVAYSNDGCMICVGGSDGMVSLWDVATGKSMSFFKGHTASVASLAFSHDDTMVVSGSDSGATSLVAWSVKTGDQMFCRSGPRIHSISRGSESNTMIYHFGNGRVTTIDLANPTRVFDEIEIKKNNLALCLSATKDEALHSGVAQIFSTNIGDGKTEQVAACTEKRTVGDVKLSVSPDGSVCARVWRDAVQVIEVASGVALANVAEPLCHSAQFSSTGKYLLTIAAYGGAAFVWDMTDIANSGGSTIKRGGMSTDEHCDDVTCLMYSPDGKRVVSGSTDSTIKVWDADTGECQHTLKGHTARVSAFDFGAWRVGAEEPLLLSGAEDGTLRMWDIVKGEEETLMSGVDGRPYAVALSPCQKYAAVGTSKRGLTVFAKWSREKVLSVVELHTDSVKLVGFSPDSTKVFSVSEDTFRLFERETGQLLVTQTFIKYYRELRLENLKIAFTPDCSAILTAGSSQRYSSDLSVVLWELPNSAAELRRKAEAEAAAAVAAEVAAARRGSDAASLDEILGDDDDDDDDVGQGEGVSESARSDDGIDGGPVGVAVADVETGEGDNEGSDDDESIVVAMEDDSLLNGPKEGVSTVAEGATAATTPAKTKGEVAGSEKEADSGGGDGGDGGDDDVAKGDEDDEGKARGKLGSRGTVFPSMKVSPHGFWCAMSPRGDLLAGRGRSENSIVIFDADDGTERLQLGHPCIVTSASFSPHGDMIVTGTCDGHVYLWDSSTGDRLHSIHAHHAAVTNIAVALSGQRRASRIASACWWERTVRVWACPPSLQSASTATGAGGDKDAGATTSVATGGGGGGGDNIDNEAPVLLDELATDEELATIGTTCPLGLWSSVVKTIRHPGGVFLCSADKGYRLFDVSDAAAYTLRVVALSPDGTSMAVGDEVGTVVVHKARGVPAHDHVIDRGVEHA